MTSFGGWGLDVRGFVGEGAVLVNVRGCWTLKVDIYKGLGGHIKGYKN